ncbi:hypothetical protein H8958_006056 [Nasalis larvatus]
MPREVTPCAHAPAGALVLLTPDCLTSLFHYIHKSTLAAVILMAVALLFDTKICRTLWHVEYDVLIPTVKSPVTWCL